MFRGVLDQPVDESEVLVKGAAQLKERLLGEVAFCAQALDLGAEALLLSRVFIFYSFEMLSVFVAGK